MNYILEGHSYRNDVQTMIQVFYPNESYGQLDAPEQAGSEPVVLSRMQIAEGLCVAAVFESGRIVAEKSQPILYGNEKEYKRLVKLTIYECLTERTGIRPPWGLLTGIRPSKMVHELWRQGLDDEGAKRALMADCLILPEKAELAAAVARAEGAVFAGSEEDSVALYIGIPFCPTRCQYCSFAAYPLEGYQNRVESYLDTLLKELAFLVPYTKGRRLESVYIGGGTPTALAEGQVERLLSGLAGLYDLSQVAEFSVEAGRPDTITREKLRLLRRYGVHRISINPQTMHQQTLDRIGRRHTVEEFISAYELARDEGFDHINIDLILGLPEETPDHVAATMERLVALSPAAVTVHTLAVKRASALKEGLSQINLTDADTMEKMLAIAASACENMGLRPYYMYRQKNSSGNFENVGYARPEYTGIYNVQIMAERQTILAAGAGAITKICLPHENRVERVPNVKNIDEYCSRIDEMLERKRKGVIL